MADVKISQLPAATTPLSGTEAVPIVQGGVTKQVAVADITPGVTAVTATAPIVSSGGSTPNISLGTVGIANGGTGQTTAAAAITALTGTQTSGYYLRSNGTNAVLAAIQAADVPTLNQNTTGTAANITATSNSTLTTLSALSLPGSQVTGNISGNAANVTGTVAIANGGTGQTTANAAFNALAPSQTGNNGKYLTTDGTNTSWATNPLGTVTSVAATVPSFLSISGSPITTSGTLAIGLSGTALPTTNGGTGLTSFTANGVVYASSTSALATGSALTFDGTNFTVANGDLTIGTNGKKLYVNYIANNSGADLNTNGLSNQIFSIGGSEQMRLTSTGLGIGTSSPDQKLTIVGNQKITGYIELRSANKIYFDDASNTAAGAIWNNASGTSALSFTGNGSTEHMRLDSSGNLGIGTSSPAKKLDVNGDALIYGLTVGRGAGAVSTNTAVGASALAANTSGSVNTAMGQGSLSSNTTGTTNSGFGQATLNANTTGNYNTAVGGSTLPRNTTGSYNTGVGSSALEFNTTASYNTAVGYRSLYLNTTGTENTSMGQGTMSANTTGSYNAAYSNNALGSNTTGSNNTALGYFALVSNTTASNNTAVGYQAGYSQTTGSGTNSYFGYQAGYGVTTGAVNTFLGYNAGASITTGSKNTIIGAYGGNQGGLDIRTASNYIVLSDGDGNPRGIFDNTGTFIVGNTSATVASACALLTYYGAVTSATATSDYSIFNKVTTATGKQIDFRSGNASVGDITSTSVATIYNTTSDYRLKTVVGAVSGQGERIDALEPIEYTWNSNGLRTRGFLAHKFQEVYADSVTGTKDAVDANGNPVYQAMQAATSEVIADLVAEIQSLRKRLAALEAK